MSHVPFLCKFSHCIDARWSEIFDISQDQAKKKEEKMTQVIEHPRIN